jgi:hypothetical protein
MLAADGGVQRSVIVFRDPGQRVSALSAPYRNLEITNKEVFMLYKV